MVACSFSEMVPSIMVTKKKPKYSSVVPDIADSGMMDGEYYIYTEIIQIYLFQFCFLMAVAS